MLYSLVQKKNWDDVARLCHFVQSKQLLAGAACMAIESKFPLLLFRSNYFLLPLSLSLLFLGRELEVAENSFAVIKV